MVAYSRNDSSQDSLMTSSDNRSYVAITMGDPAGIGPEVTAKALTDNQVSGSCLPFVIGNTDVMKMAFKY